MKSSLKIMRMVSLPSIILLAIILTACGGGGGSTSTPTPGDNATSPTPGDDATSVNLVTIKGTFSGGTNASNRWFNRFLYKALLSYAHALDPNSVTKVLIFNTNGGYVLSDVEDGSFSIEIEKGLPVGMIFVGAADNFVGYLTLGNGIDSLPLNYVGDNVTTIDLETLSSSGLVVEPSHNPLGAELPLTAEEQTGIAQSDDFFASIVKNPDVDGNGIIDFLEGRFFGLQILYYLNGGGFNGNLSPTVNEPADITGYRLAFDATDADRPDNVDFTGPPGSGLLNSTSDQSNIYADRTTYFSPYINSPSIPPAGQYTIDYKTSTLTFTLPDQPAAPSNIVLPVATVTLNDDRTIQKVNWVYRLGSGATAALDPLTIISIIELQIDGSGSPCASYPQQGRIYNSGWLSASATEHVLTCQTLYWDDVTAIGMAYEDLYENHYVITWNISQSDAPANFDSSASPAIEWAYNRIGEEEWKGWCLRFVACAFQQDENGHAIYWNSAWEAAQGLELYNQSYDGWLYAPRGALIFFYDADGQGLLHDYGHVGIYLGDENMIHAHWDDGVKTDPVEILEQHYIGWAYPPEEWRPTD